MAENSYSSPAPLPPEGATGDGADLGDAAHTDPDNVRDLGDIPAIEVITRSIVMLMSAAAEKGRDSTVDLVARIGRASRLGERSRGVLDAGATSCCLILSTFGGAIARRLG